VPYRHHTEGALALPSFERILLIKPSSLGDVIHALPALDGLRRRYPTARIDWLIGTPFVSLLVGHPHLDGLVEFDRKRFGRLWRSPAAAMAFVRFIQQLRQRRYDLVIDLQGLFRTGFFAWASGAETRVGFGDARETAPLFYTHRLPGGSGNVHAVDRYLQVGDLLGFAPASVRFALPLTETDRTAAADLLRYRVSGPDTRIVVVAPGARWDTKCWLPERYASTIDALQGPGDDIACVLLGGPDEAHRCAEITSGCRSAPLDLAGKTTLRQLVALIERADLVICQDSATAHIAAALDRPLVCITGPTNPLRTGPYGRISDVVWLEPECAPCYLRRLSQCPHDHRCMRDLTVDQVLDAARQALNVPAN